MKKTLIISLSALVIFIILNRHFASPPTIVAAESNQHVGIVAIEAPPSNKESSIKWFIKNQSLVEESLKREIPKQGRYNLYFISYHGSFIPDNYDDTVCFETTKNQNKCLDKDYPLVIRFKDGKILEYSESKRTWFEKLNFPG
jgi:hypothetical protein